MRRRTFWSVLLSLSLLVAAGCSDDTSAGGETPEETDASDVEEEPVDGGDVAPPEDGEGEEDTGEEDDVDGDGDVDGGTDESCNYEGESVGICTEGVVGADGECQEPEDYESDETTCDGIDNDCDGIVDEDCGCDYRENDEGVCGDATRDAEGNCQQPEDYESDEVTCDGVDNDCDGVVDEGCVCDYDGESTGVCGQAIKQDDGSCPEPDDYESDETTCDAKDNDCDGDVDEGCTCNEGDTEACYTGPSGTAGVGACETGTRTCQADETWGTCEGETTPTTETCDGEDNDCDGTVDEGCQCDYDDTSEGVCSEGTLDSDGNCSQPGDYESDEVSCDGLDNDCDGTVDEGCSCNFDDTSEGVCSDGTVADDGTCQEPADYEEDETSCDGRDNDCDGEVDENCTCDPGETETCYTGPSGTAGTGVCEEGSRECAQDGTWGPCEGETTPSNETCDGEDNDCDGTVDEGCSCDYEGKSAGVCEDQTIDSDGNCPEPDNYEETEETCGDGLDNDCDGDADCGDGDCDNVQCNGEGTECQSGDGRCHEIACDDGIDNDGDNGADECDPNDCGSESCGDGARCIGGECTETNCGDGEDNDGDGDVDCEDDDCDRLQCDGDGGVCCPNSNQCKEPADCVSI